MRNVESLDCILLIDDDRPTNFIHKKTIMSMGLDTHIQVCESGQDALDYLNCEGTFSEEKSFPQPGVVFLDINMPGMNGWDFLEHYHHLPENRKAKIIVAMLTTSSNPDDKERVDKDSAVKTIYSKPLKHEYLEEIIETYFS